MMMMRAWLLAAVVLAVVATPARAVATTTSPHALLELALVRSLAAWGKGREREWRVGESASSASRRAILSCATRDANAHA